jgi:uncharacterized protein YqgC (DUF456 family)
MTILLWILGMALVVVGLAGIVFPALPGTILIFLGLLLAAWADGFTRVGLFPLALIGLIGAALGTLLGLPFGILGVIFGPLAGALVGEWSVHRDFARAGKAGMAAWLGFLIGTAVKVAMAFSMIAIFLVALFLL